MSNDQFSEISVNLTKNLSKETKKNNGIYFTPLTTVLKLIDTINPFITEISSPRILEPSCGSGEFIFQLCNRYKNNNLTIEGVENNSEIFTSIQSFWDKNKESKQNVNLFCCDYLQFEPTEQYDLILGNPPFFVMKKKEVDETYYPFFDCRPNMFLLFIIKSLNHLKLNGILSFVLPKSFLNCLYYNKTRELLNKECVFIDIQECEDEYIETKQDTIILTLQKRHHASDNEEYLLSLHDFTVFGTKSTISEINILLNQSTNLYDMGFDVTVGNIVWNQCKDILTDDIQQTRLIYSSDIQNNKLGMKNYENPDKKNFIHKSGLTGPLLVINRGYGTGNYIFEFCLINIQQEYLIENHLICIRPKSNESMTKKKLLASYKKIISSLQNNKTKRFIQLYFGNNALNTTELKHILPIYL